MWKTSVGRFGLGLVTLGAIGFGVILLINGSNWPKTSPGAKTTVPNQIPTKPAPTAAGPSRVDKIVSVQATTDRPDDNGNQVVSVTFVMDTSEHDWHIYSNRLPEGFPGKSTSISVTGRVPLEGVNVDYPEGKRKNSKDYGPYNIYEGPITIKATVKRSKGDTSPLEVSATYQACWGEESKGECLSPTTVKISVP